MDGTIRWMFYLEDTQGPGQDLQRWGLQKSLGNNTVKEGTTQETERLCNETEEGTYRRAAHPGIPKSHPRPSKSMCTGLIRSPRPPGQEDPPKNQDQPIRLLSPQAFESKAKLGVCLKLFSPLYALVRHSLQNIGLHFQWAMGCSMDFRQVVCHPMLCLQVVDYHLAASPPLL